LRRELSRLAARAEQACGAEQNCGEPERRAGIDVEDATWCKLQALGERLVWTFHS
jgi:hypothetical protein